MKEPRNLNDLTIHDLQPISDESTRTPQCRCSGWQGSVRRCGRRRDASLSILSRSLDLSISHSPASFALKHTQTTGAAAAGGVCGDAGGGGKGGVGVRHRRARDARGVCTCYPKPPIRVVAGFGFYLKLGIRDPNARGLYPKPETRNPKPER